MDFFRCVSLTQHFAYVMSQAELEKERIFGMNWSLG